MHKGKQCRCPVLAYCLSGFIISSMTFILFQNESQQQQIIKETFQLVSKRDDNVCNFLEGGSLIGGSDYKLIYRYKPDLELILSSLVLK